jgi:hypothetical protein
MQENGKAQKMSDTYGPTSEMPLARYDLPSQSWRTCEDTSLWDLPMSLETLPAWGMTRGGVLFELPMPEHHTDAHEFSSLPTPHAGLGERGRDGVYPNPKGQQDLQHALAYLPTPLARDSKEQVIYDGSTMSPTGQQASVLSRKLALLPTPTTQETHSGPSQGMRNTVPLNHLVTMLPTPTCQAAKHPTMDDRGIGTPDDSNLWSVLGRLLPTPTVMDMGGGRTAEDWEAWKQAMKASHGNGNGHGASLEQEALSIGASTPAQSPDGNTPLADQRQRPLSDAKTEIDSTLFLWNG